MKIKSLKIDSKKIIILLIFVLLILRIIFLTPVFSDETIYFNMAKAVSNGLIPYKDFFYAHPPIQLLLFAIPFKLFGVNFFATKIYMTIILISCLILTYLIAKRLFDEKSAFVSFFFFLLFPGSLIFGNQAMGMFEALLFFLIGFYLLLEKKTLLSSLFFVFSILTRYLTIFLFPFIFLYILKFEKKILIEFSKKIILLFIASLVILFVLFGKEFLVDTIYYHFSANIKFQASLADWIDQYFVLGIFTFFFSVFCIVFSIFKKNKKLTFFSLYPIFYDLAVLLLFRQVIYHYFILPLPFLFIAIGKTFTESKDIFLRSFLVFILLMSIFTNLQSLDLYFNKKNNEVLDELVKYTIENTEKNDLLFGEPRSLNYVSFMTDKKIINNYFDSDLKFISFIGQENILNKIGNKPKLIFATNSYMIFFKKYYGIENKWNKKGYYNIVLLKKTP